MIEIYTKPNCPACVEAKQLLDGDDYIEYDVTHAKYKELLLERFPAARTVPQIFMNGVHIGGRDELKELLKGN